MTQLTVLHIFSGDLWAGAEVMGFNLLSKLITYPDVKIIALILNEGTLSKKLKNIGVETYVISENENRFPIIFVKANSLLKAKNIDVIHSHRYKENLLALLLARARGIKCLVTTIHGKPETIKNRNNRKQSIKWFSKINYFLMKHYFAMVVAVSDEIKKCLIIEHSFRADNVNVIYNGICIPYINENVPHTTNKTYNIGTVGRMVPVKNHELFLEIAAKIKESVNDVQFSILGDGPLKNRLIEKTKALNIENDVNFLMPQIDTLPYYQSLDIYLNTSQHEGIPLSILEAMACKKPVVAPNIGGIPEIITNGIDGMLVTGNMPEEYAGVCIKLIQNDELRSTISKNARERIITRFDNSSMTASYMELYKKYS